MKCHKSTSGWHSSVLFMTFHTLTPPPPLGRGDGAKKASCVGRGRKKAFHCEGIKKKKDHTGVLARRSSGRMAPYGLFYLLPLFPLPFFPSSISFLPSSPSFFFFYFFPSFFSFLFLLLLLFSFFFPFSSSLRQQAAANSSKQQQAAAAAAASSSSQQQGPAGQSTENSYDSHKNNRSAQQPAEAHRRHSST